MAYASLRFGEEFLETLLSRDFTDADRAAFIKALRLLDANERHPSLRVHRLEGGGTPTWSASASKSLRMTFQRHINGVKQMLSCSKHYDR